MWDFGFFWDLVWSPPKLRKTPLTSICLFGKSKFQKYDITVSRSGSTSGANIHFFQKINFGTVRSVWAARRTVAHWFLTSAGLFGILPTHVGVLYHDPSGGPWSVVIGHLETLYYNLPNQSHITTFRISLTYRNLHQT